MPYQHHGKETMNIDKLVESLGAEWDIEEGSLYLIRNGKFDSAIADHLLAVLDDVTLDDPECLPRRVVSLLWFIPVFLYWNAERVEDVSGISHSEYESFIIKVSERLMKLLGVP